MKHVRDGLVWIAVATGVACGCSSRPGERDGGSLWSATGIEPGQDSGSDSVANEIFLDVSVSQTTQGEAGCEKVDLLFVIDNSGSMADEQANLVASFPGFIAAMRESLADTDGYHVGVTTTDLYSGNPFDGLPCPREGSLVTSTGGRGSSQQICTPYASGRRYMTELDDLEATFACAARVGIGGEGNERPMQTLMAAISPEMGQSGACNEGFLRDDALLVVVLITDEEDDHERVACAPGAPTGGGSNGDPEQWFDRVVAAKGGDETALVVLALVGPDGLDSRCPPLDKCNGAVVGAEVGTRLLDFTRRFTHGIVGSVCAPYAPFFQDAIRIIDSACNDYVPPG